MDMLLGLRHRRTLGAGLLGNPGFRPALRRLGNLWFGAATQADIGKALKNAWLLARGVLGNVLNAVLLGRHLALDNGREGFDWRNSVLRRGLVLRCCRAGGHGGGLHDFRGLR